jgi:UDP-N-acetylglucosamine transferase subunit ALG13
MIFVTVGTQLPFERLVSAVDLWAGKTPGVEVFAQIGPAGVAPGNIRSVDFLPPDRADRMFREAELIVSHAGMGSIITALRYRKPLLICPRKAAFGEHRNDHQVATAKWLGTRNGIYVAWSEEDVPAFLDRRGELSLGGDLSESADPGFISRLRGAMLEPVEEKRWSIRSLMHAKGK